MAETAKTVMWFRELLAELGLPQEGPTLLHVDNQSAMALANDPVLHERTKHIKRRYHFTRAAIQERVLKLQYCPTEDQLADGLTKALTKERHMKLALALGLRP